MVTAFSAASIPFASVTEFLQHHSYLWKHFDLSSQCWRHALCIRFSLEASNRRYWYHLSSSSSISFTFIRWMEGKGAEGRGQFFFCWVCRPRDRFPNLRDYCSHWLCFGLGFVVNDDGGILLSLRIVLCLGAPLTKRLVNLLLNGKWSSPWFSPPWPRGQ